MTPTIESEPEAVRHFDQTLTLKPGGSVYEMNGERVLIRVMPVQDEWTPEKNVRRRTLIDRKLDRVITSDELLELEILQEEMHAHVEKVAPLPLEYAHRLHDELLAKAVANGKA